MNLSHRTARILELTVEIYIESAQPISSASIAKRLKSLQVSPATIRHEMAALERMGLLHQPHTSSGRVPTAQGLRFFLNQTLKPKLHSKDRRALDRAVAETPPTQLAVELGRTIAGLSRQMTAVVVPRFLVLSLKEFGLVRIDAGRFLAYFVSTGGVVQQRMVEMDFDLTEAEVTHIQNYLNSKLTHLSLSEIRVLLEKDLEEQRKEMNRLERSALEIGRKALPNDVPTDLTIDGASHLCDKPEFADTEKLQQLLKVVESKTALVTLLERFLSDGSVTIVLNSEHNILEVPDLTCVGRALKTTTSGQNVASISILGPSRMDYARVVPMINYASELLERQWIGV